MKVLAIESSCDDTSIAIVDSFKKIKYIQTINHHKFHKDFGGVVPEMAARQHLDIMDMVLKNISPQQLKTVDYIAATYGPGLIGGLIVGSSIAKGIAIALNKPLIPINHLQAHLLSPRMIAKITFPYLCLLASGGNTAIVLIESEKKFKVLGSTIDDSAGECFDKVAKFMGLGYPGGPALEELAIGGDENAFILPKPLTKTKNCNFSFSGLKTSAIRIVESGAKTKFFRKNFAASFQRSISDILKIKISNAIDLLDKKNIKIKDFSICGGVAANKIINNNLKEFVNKNKINFYQVPLSLCTDNAAMIGWNALELAKTISLDKNNYNIRPTPNILINKSFVK
ncbi:tRNA (adenosine(37)-N6)-threonylcarbamoyltransferase complex transferase subunit TsaD [Alphaproteobacteria bacterium]|nr:tRNA (adenosine(37)-N6)-threonylcarbamoyltransferase complex transferase subunit TsaD [Alphaproteobacteria bacterium]